MTDTLPEPAPAVFARDTGPAARTFEPATKPRARLQDSEAATVFEMPAIDLASVHASLAEKHASHVKMESAALTTGQLDKVVPKAKIQRKITEDDKPTMVSMAAITDADLSSVRAPAKASTPAPASAATPARAGLAKSAPTPAPVAKAPVISAPAEAAGKKKFSETAWFMAAVNPDQLAEIDVAAADLPDSEGMTARYAVGEALPDDVRKDFSLSEDAKKAKKNK